MAEPRTTPTDDSVERFLDSVADEGRREDARSVCRLMEQVTGEPPTMWGTSIVGFGSHHYVYDSGREGDTMVVGFAPRKAALTLYVMDGFEGRDDMLGRLGKHSTGKACLYVKHLADVDEAVLRELVAASWRHTTTGA